MPTILTTEQSSGYSTAGNPWFAVTLGLVGLIVGYGIGTFNPSGTTTIAAAGDNPPVVQVPDAPAVPAEPTNFDPPTTDDDPVLGDENAQLTLVEFTDYQCPFCHRHFTETFAQIKSQYVDTGKIKYVVRDYPLSFHPNAEPAALASECADDQGEFWAMHDQLFETNPTWSNVADAAPLFKQYAADLGLNTATFNNCLDSKTHAGEVAQDMADGSASGVSGTPGFWLIGPDGEGQIISGAVPFATFKQAIDAML
ncbi:DsbA family protein [Candidatus Peregrinibacteria bacterium]|nr:DsbA family protein [Candidatus Peregrinibacteria bacterium]